MGLGGGGRRDSEEGRRILRGGTEGRDGRTAEEEIKGREEEARRKGGTRSDGGTAGGFAHHPLQPEITQRRATAQSTAGSQPRRGWHCTTGATSRPTSGPGGFNHSTRRAKYSRARYEAPRHAVRCRCPPRRR